MIQGKKRGWGGGVAVAYLDIHSLHKETMTNVYKQKQGQNIHVAIYYLPTNKAAIILNFF